MILANKIDTKKEKEAIRTFRENVTSTKEHLGKLEKEVGGAQYDEKKHIELQAKIDQIKDAIKQVTLEIGRLESHIKEMKKNLATKTELENQKSKLELKFDDLAVLKKLFRGGGC